MTVETTQPRKSLLSQNRGLLVIVMLLALLPFIVGLFEGAMPGQVWQNESGTSKFVQGLGIEDLYPGLICPELRPDIRHYWPALFWTFHVFCDRCLPDWHPAQKF